MKILVVDDHPLVVDALARLLPQIDPTIDVLAAMDSSEAIVVNEPDIALVLLDLALQHAASAFSAT
jgi:DNA-binding NarL/FixJ family response regulator